MFNRLTHMEKDGFGRKKSLLGMMYNLFHNGFPTPFKLFLVYYLIFASQVLNMFFSSFQKNDTVKTKHLI